MMMLSDPTLGMLIEAAAKQSRASASDLKTMLLRADLERYVPAFGVDANKQELVRLRLVGARDAHYEGDADARKALLRFVRLLVEKEVTEPDDPPSWFLQLREHLLADGLQLTCEARDADGRWDAPRAIVRLLPTDASVAPLAEEITALEVELEKRGYHTPLRHYRQAVAGLADHKYESANGQSRTTLEALVVQLAKDHEQYVGQGRAGEGGQAITWLIDQGALPEADGGGQLRGLWKMIQTHGPHPGQSDASEARFRLQMITATALFLLRHFPS